MRRTVCLDGTWKFCPAFDELEGNQRFMKPGFDAERPEAERPGNGNAGWTQPDFDDRGWFDVTVPSSWNVAIPDLWSYEGHGWYRKRVVVPDSWRGRRAAFASEGANYRTVVHVNGVEAGEHDGGYTPFEVPIDHLLRYGEENTLAVAVDNLPKPERCPGGQYDWWNHGGLYRTVRLVATEKTYVDEVVAVTAPGDEGATVRVTVRVVDEDGAGDTVEVAGVLHDPTGAKVASGGAAVEFHDGVGEVCLGLSTPNPLLWSPDTPNLHVLHIELRERGTGRRLDEWKRRIGIRWIEVRGTQLLLNGQPFVIKGLNRYEDYRQSGRTPDEKALRRDLELIKSIGGNTIRCHFPNSPQTYDICDEMGVFFVSELPFYQWGRPLVGTDAPEALGSAKAQLREMIRWQRNHPSVLLWSVSNENLCKPLRDTQEYRRLANMTVEGNLELVDLVHELDPTRPAIEASNCWPGDRVFERTDISAVNVYIGASTPHVRTVGELAERMHERLEALRVEHPEKPILIAELGSWGLRGLKTDYYPGEGYQAALIRTYWEALEKEPGVIGGIIWCFADSDVHRRFEWVYEYRVAYGLFDIDRNPKEAAETVRQLWTR